MLTLWHVTSPADVPGTPQWFATHNFLTPNGLPPHVDFIVGQQELGEIAAATTGKDTLPVHRHWQIYVEMDDRYSTQQMLTLLGLPHTFGNRKRKPGEMAVHAEPRKGTQSGCIDYCTKEETQIVGTQFRAGTKHKPDAVGGHKDVVAAIATGKVSFKEIALNFPMEVLRHGGNVSRLLSAFEIPPDPKTRNVVVRIFWGTTRSGKSTGAEYFETAWFGTPWYQVYYKNSNPKWWDRYEHQKAIVIEEFDWKKWPIDEILKLFDARPMQVENKGGSRWLHHERIYLTSNTDPKTWYKDKYGNPVCEPQVYEAFWERIQPTKHGEVEPRVFQFFDKAPAPYPLPPGYPPLYPEFEHPQQPNAISTVPLTHNPLTDAAAASSGAETPNTQPSVARANSPPAFDPVSSWFLNNKENNLETKAQAHLPNDLSLDLFLMTLNHD